MKIAVCFKVVPDFDQVIEADWDNFSLSADLKYVRRIFGCFDESALETALRLRSAWEELGEKTECTAITAVPLPSPLCKTLFAAGFDRVLDLSGASCGEFGSRHTAALLGSCLGPVSYDLILAGRQAGYADTGTIPLFLAEILNIPAVTEAGEITPCSGGVEVKRTSDTGRERLRLRLPLLVVVGNSPVSALRAVTLNARMAASKRSAEKPERVLLPRAAEITGEEPDLDGTPRFGREKRHKACRFLPAGAGLAQSAVFLVTEYLNRGKK